MKCKNIISLVSALALMSVNFNVAYATSSLDTESNLNVISEQIVVHNCETKDNTIITHEFESVINNYTESQSVDSELELYSPGHSVNILDVTYESLNNGVSVLSEVTDSGLTKVATPSSYGQYRNTVYVELYVRDGNADIYVGSSTGFMIGPNTVATAGHVIYDDEYGKLNSSGEKWVNKVIVRPGRNKTSSPYGYATATEFITSTYFIKDRNVNHDWGIIRLDKNIGDSVGWLGLKYTASSIKGKYVKFTGYPYKVDGMPNYDMYYGNGTVAGTIMSGLVYADGSIPLPGHSGSPVYVYSSDTGYTALGIVTRSSTDGFGLLKLSEWLYNEFISYRSLRA